MLSWLGLECLVLLIISFWCTAMNDDVTEWLRWQIANLLLFQRVSSSLTVVG